jgi:membrane associated rhomboid family serine protease
MIPLGDSARTGRTPWVNLTLIGANALVFLYELSLGPSLDPFIGRWGVVPARISGALAGSPDVPRAFLVTLITAAFLHSGWLHLGGNMLFLWIFGDNVEDRLGHAEYLLFYLAGAVVANLAQVLVDPASTVPAIGASGAIAAVLGAYAVSFPGARVSVILPVLLIFWTVQVPALIMIGVWFATQFFSGIASLTQMSAQAGGVAWWAHVGGFVFGIVLMVILPKRPADYREPPGRTPRERAQNDTGPAGFLIGTIAMISQIVQIALGLRVVAVFLGLENLPRLGRLVLLLVRLTNPIVGPLQLFLPTIRLLGQPFQLSGVVGILIVYLIGTALIWATSDAFFGERASSRRIV